jgi:hypothetical protein
MDRPVRELPKAAKPQKFKVTASTRFFLDGREVKEREFIKAAKEITAIDVAADGVSIRVIKARSKKP